MESRLLLSAIPLDPQILNHFALTPILKHPIQNGTAQPAAGATSPSGVGGLSVAQLRGAYGLGQYNASNMTFNGAQGDGTGQTIAIVDAYHDPNLLSDLQTFDSAEGLPGPPSISVLNQTGGTTPPTNDVQNPGSSSDWAGEECLDVQWAHAMAPGAAILVIECNSASNSDAVPGGHHRRGIRRGVGGFQQLRRK